MISPRKVTLLGIALASCSVAATAQAEENSDTSLSYGFGTHFGEPYAGNDVTKNILGITHRSDYRYGSNYFNGQVELSDKHNSAGPGTDSGGQDVSLSYRNTLSANKVFGKPDAFSFGPIRDIGITAGVDFDNRDASYYDSRKRMAVVGPTVMFKVPGYLNASILSAWESDAPYNKVTGIQSSRQTYDTYPILNVNWGVPFSVGPVALSYEGDLSYAASKGTNAFGDKTKPETDLDMRVMYDVGQWMGAGKDTLRLGLEYQYIHNYDGFDHNGPAGKGADTSTPLVRAEYHF